MKKAKDLAKALDEAALAYKPLDAVKMIEFAKPEVIEPTIVYPSGQERRRERRKQARKASKNNGKLL